MDDRSRCPKTIQDESTWIDPFLRFGSTIGLEMVGPWGEPSLKGVTMLHTDHTSKRAWAQGRSVTGRAGQDELTSWSGFPLGKVLVSKLLAHRLLESGWTRAGQGLGPGEKDRWWWRPQACRSLTGSPPKISAQFVGCHMQLTFPLRRNNILLSCPLGHCSRTTSDSVGLQLLHATSKQSV